MQLKVNISQFPVITFFILAQICQLFAIWASKELSGHSLSVFDYARQWEVYIIILMLISQAYFWQQVLKMVPLSKVYPATAVQFPLVMILGYLAYEDQISSNMIFGVFLISVGVACLLWKSDK